MAGDSPIAHSLRFLEHYVLIALTKVEHYILILRDYTPPHPTPPSGENRLVTEGAIGNGLAY